MPAIEELSEEARTLALTRYKSLSPHLEGERTLRSVAIDAGIPFRTAQRWVKLYRKSGLAALARKRRSDEGSRKAYSQRLLEAIEGLALKRPPITDQSAVPLALDKQVVLAGEDIELSSLNRQIGKLVAIALDDGSSQFKRVGASLAGDLHDLRQFESIGGLGSSQIYAVGKPVTGFARVVQAKVILGVLYNA